MTSTIAVIGCGSMGRRRIRHAKELAHADVIGWDIRADRRREVETQFGIRTAESEAALFEARPAAMFISVPPAEHEHYIFAAIERGIPFMVEQPISHELDRLDRILAGVRERRLVCHVSCNQRYSPRVLTMKRVLDEGRVGKVLTGFVELGEWLPDWHPYEPYTDYYPSWRRMGGGMDAICDLDWMLFLFGKVRQAKSMCGRKSNLDIDTFDVVQMMLDFEDGPQFVLHCDMLQQPFHRQSRFVCANGMIVHNHPNQLLQVYVADDKRWSEVPFDVDLSKYPHMQGKPQHGFAEPMYQADSQMFLDRLGRGDTSLDSLELGIANLRLTYPLIWGNE